MNLEILILMDYNNSDKYKKIIDARLNQIYVDGPNLLKKPINHIIHGGKRLRPILCVLSNEACNGKLEDVISPAVSIELLHIFSLIHDDIMDDDQIRHNKQTIHSKWNIPVGILAGDAVLALAFKELNNSSNLIKEKFNSALIAVCEGQALDIEYENTKSLTLEKYLDMINLKTAYMIGLSAELGAIVSGVDKSISDLFKNLGLLIGKAFQLQDDLLEVTSTSQKMGKTLNSDIILSKKTYLFLTAEKKYPNHLDQIYLNNKNDINKLNNEVKSFLNNTEIINDCKDNISLIFEEINECLNQLNINNSQFAYFVNNIRKREF